MDICLKKWKDVMNTFRFYSTVVSLAWILDFQEKEIKCLCGRLTHLFTEHLFCSSGLFMSTFAESDSLSLEKDTQTHTCQRAAKPLHHIDEYTTSPEKHFDSHILTPTLSLLSKCYIIGNKALMSCQMRGRENWIMSPAVAVVFTRSVTSFQRHYSKCTCGSAGGSSSALHSVVSYLLWFLLQV